MSSHHNDTGEAVARYFRAKSSELIALADLPVTDHPGLRGSHREQIYRTYLKDLLPRRYSVGRGMVYGQFHRSREADIVVWDSQAYPSLPLRDHSFFFAESVRAVLECKSNWSATQFADVLDKSKAVRDIVLHKEPSLADELAQIQLDLVSLKLGRPHQGLLISGHHIGTTALFLKGGKRQRPDQLIKSCPDLDDSWPDVLLLLEPGLLALKVYPDETGIYGSIMFFRYGEHSLLAFSSALLKLLDDRVVHSESRFYLDVYAYPFLRADPIAAYDFRLSRLPPGRQALWQ